MFRVTPNGPNRVDIEYSGKIDSDEMKVALDELLDKTKEIKHGRMMYRVGEFKLPTLAAIQVELSRTPELLKLMGRFDRAAVVADQKWLQTVSEIEGMLIPGLKIKAFDLDEEAAAEAWLMGE